MSMVAQEQQGYVAGLNSAITSLGNIIGPVAAGMLFDVNVNFPYVVASGRLVSDGFIQCFICEMIVMPEYQGRGLGKEVMTNLLEHCKNNGIRWVQLACAKGKTGFYEKFGFQQRAAEAPGMNLFL